MIKIINYLWKRFRNQECKTILGIDIDIADFFVLRSLVWEDRITDVSSPGVLLMNGFFNEENPKFSIRVGQVGKEFNILKYKNGNLNYNRNFGTIKFNIKKKYH